MAESIRTFGGDLAANPIWVLVPTTQPLSIPTQETLKQLKTKIITFEVDPEIHIFPFATKIVAAAFAEEQAKGQTKRLIFMDSDTLVLQEPTEFLIADDKTLGYRPVHHKLIGSAWDDVLDSFWKLIYEVCDVPSENIFPMMTHAGEQIRPYFNAGMFALRPERGLLAQWKDVFQKWYRQPEFRTYYEKDQLYAIFIHQAIFTGILLHNLKPDDMHEFNPKINYPLHLHKDIPAKQRPTTINELITIRYEGIFDEPGWQQLPIMEPLKSWLESRLKLHKSLGEII
jgi:hypothetical protein